jgi:hypothetical protein
MGLYTGLAEIANPNKTAVVVNTTIMIGLLFSPNFFPAIG